MKFEKELNKVGKYLNNNVLKWCFLLFCVGLIVYWLCNYNTDKDRLTQNHNLNNHHSEYNSEPNGLEPNGLAQNGLAQNGLEQNGLEPSSNTNNIQNPSDLLPKDANNEWSKLNPTGSTNLNEVNLLKAGYHSGVDTIGSTLRNANLQVRSEPPNPTSKVSPWLNSTIEPDMMRTPLELGCGKQ